MTKNKYLVTSILLILFLFNQNSLMAQDDIYEMDLEDVMDIALDRSTVLGLPHPHSKGETMFQYSFMKMKMSGLQDGITSLETNDVLASNTAMIAIAPVNMDMDMHMLMFMYSISDKITLNFMEGYIIKNMDMTMRIKGIIGGMDTLTDVESQSQGFGDMEAAIYYTVYNKNQHVFLANLALMLPFGSVNEFGTDRNDNPIKSAYPMQLGSGTVDPKFSVTYLNTTMKYSFGVDLGTTLRLYNNKFDYHKGNEYNLKIGGAYNWKKWLSSTVRLDAKMVDSYAGADSDYTPMLTRMSPNRNVENFGGTRIDGALGLAFKVSNGALKDVSLLVDYSLPLYQNLNGPQMTTSNITTIAVKYVFGHKTLN